MWLSGHKHRFDQISRCNVIFISSKEQTFQNLYFLLGTINNSRLKKNYIFIFKREGRGEKQRERNIDQLPLIRAPNRGPNLQPRHVPWLGVEAVTSHFAGQWPTKGAALVRATIFDFSKNFPLEKFVYRNVVMINLEGKPHKYCIKSTFYTIKYQTCFILITIWQRILTPL